MPPSSTPYVVTDAPVRLFPWLPPLVVEEAWTWFTQCPVDSIVARALDGDSVDDEQHLEQLRAGARQIICRLSNDEVAAWLLLTDLAGRIAPLAGSAPEGTHWEIPVVYVRSDANPVSDKIRALAAERASLVLSSVCRGDAPQPLPGLGAHVIVLAFFTLLTVLCHLHAGKPVLAVGDSSST